MIYIIRHGQTAWNLQGRKQGRKDSPLTLKGIQQAKNVAKTLKDSVSNYEDFKVVVSPQWRCQQFASIVCELIGVDFSECIFEEGLREHCFGLWEGKTEEEIEREFPGYLNRRYKPENYWSYIVPMGESYQLLDARVSKVLKKYEACDIIYICHEMVSKVIRGRLLSKKPEDVLAWNHPQNIIYKIYEKNIENLNTDGP